MQLERDTNTDLRMRGEYLTSQELLSSDKTPLHFAAKGPPQSIELLRERLKTIEQEFHVKVPVAMRFPNYISLSLIKENILGQRAMQILSINQATGARVWLRGQGSG